MGYRDAQWYIKDNWIGFSARRIAKQVVAHHTFMASRAMRAAWNGEIVAFSSRAAWETKLLIGHRHGQYSIKHT